MAHVELASLDSICKDVDHIAVAWFAPIHPLEPPDAMGVYSSLASKESRDALTHHCDNLYTELADTFELLSIPQECEIKHNIELLPDSTIPSKQ